MLTAPAAPVAAQGRPQPPAPTILSPSIHTFTASTSFGIKGSSNLHTRVLFFVDSDHNGRYNSDQDDLRASFDVDEDGNFSGDVPLFAHAGSTVENNMAVVAVDSLGFMSPPTQLRITATPSVPPHLAQWGAALDQQPASYMNAPITEFPAPVLVPATDDGILEPYAVQSAGIGRSDSDMFQVSGYGIELAVPSANGFAFAELTGSLGSDAFNGVQSANGQCSPADGYCNYTYTSNRLQFSAEQFQAAVGSAPGVIWHSPSLLADGSGPGPGPERWEILWYVAGSNVTYRLVLGGAAGQLVGSGTPSVDPSNAPVAQQLADLAASLVPVKIGPLPEVAPPAPAPAPPSAALVAQPAPVLEQLPVTFAGGPVRQGNGGLAEQTGPEFSLAGGDYVLTWSAASHTADYCSVYPDLKSPQQSLRTPDMDLHPGSASAHTSKSGHFVIGSVPAGEHYRLVVLSGCDQWTVRLSR